MSRKPTVLTVTAIDALPAKAKKAKKRITAFDARTPGLCVRVTETGHVGYYVMSRDPTGRQKWAEVRDGNAPVTTLSAARRLAPQGVANIKNGREAFPRVEPEPEPNTFERVRERFIDEWAKPRNRSWAEQKWRLKSTGWDKREIGTIRKRDVLEYLARIGKDSGGTSANRALSAVHKFFAWATEQDIIGANPAAGVKKPAKEVSRDRVLSDAELVAFWKATGELAFPWGPYLRVLALTGQRRGEVAAMRWRDVRLDGDEPLWTLPREATKADRRHDVPLSDQVVAILRALPRFTGGDFVFTTTDGSTHVKAYSDLKATIDSKLANHMEGAEVEDWHLHDLRRSMASTCARLHVAPHVVSAILNHSPGRSFGVTAVYLRHDFADEKRSALKAWASYIERLASPKEANVVALPARAEA